MAKAATPQGCPFGAAFFFLTQRLYTAGESICDYIMDAYQLSQLAASGIIAGFDGRDCCLDGDCSATHEDYTAGWAIGRELRTKYIDKGATT